MEGTWTLVLGICGGVITISGAIAAIVKWMAPAFKLTARVREIERKQAADYATIKDTQAMSRLMCKAMLGLIEHEVTGNSIDKLKQTKLEIQNFLIDMTK